MALDKATDSFEISNGLKVSVARDTSILGPGDRDKVLGVFDAVTNLIWKKPERLFRESGSKFFVPDATVFLIQDGGVPVGFSLVRTFSVDGRPVLFRWFNNIDPRYQRRGLIMAITRYLAEQEMASGEGLPTYCLRTRNPIRWLGATRYTKRMAPDLLKGEVHEDLQELGLKIASVVYPGSEIDPVSLGMPNSFPPGSGYQEPYHLADASLDHRFYSHPAISNPQGGILFVGELDADFFRPG